MHECNTVSYQTFNSSLPPEKTPLLMDSNTQEEQNIKKIKGDAENVKKISLLIARAILTDRTTATTLLNSSVGDPFIVIQQAILSQNDGNVRRIVAYLLQKNFINSESIRSHPLTNRLTQLAVVNDYSKTLVVLIKNNADVSRNPKILLKSVKKGHLEATKILIENRVDIEQSDKNTQERPLHKAVSLITPNSLEVLNILLKARANLEVRNKDGETPFLLAMRLSRFCFAQELIKFGCQVDTQDYTYRNGFSHLLPCHFHLSGSVQCVEHIARTFFLADMFPTDSDMIKACHEKRCLYDIKVRRINELHHLPSYTSLPSEIIQIIVQYMLGTNNLSLPEFSSCSTTATYTTNRRVQPNPPQKKLCGCIIS